MLIHIYTNLLFLSYRNYHNFSLLITLTNGLPQLKYGWYRRQRRRPILQPTLILSNSAPYMSIKYHNRLPFVNQSQRIAPKLPKKRLPLSKQTFRPHPQIHEPKSQHFTNPINLPNYSPNILPNSSPNILPYSEDGLINLEESFQNLGDSLYYDDVTNEPFDTNNMKSDYQSLTLNNPKQVLINHKRHIAPLDGKDNIHVFPEIPEFSKNGPQGFEFAGHHAIQNIADNFKFDLPGKNHFDPQPHQQNSKFPPKRPTFGNHGFHNKPKFPHHRPEIHTEFHHKPDPHIKPFEFHKPDISVHVSIDHNHHPPAYHEPETYHEPEPYHKPETYHEPQTYHKPETYHEPQTHHEPQSYHEPQTYHEPETYHEPQNFHEPQTYHEPQIHHQDVYKQPEVYHKPEVTYHEPIHNDVHSSKPSYGSGNEGNLIF